MTFESWVRTIAIVNWENLNLRFSTRDCVFWISATKSQQLDCSNVSLWIWEIVKQRLYWDSLPQIQQAESWINWVGAILYRSIHNFQSKINKIILVLNWCKQIAIASLFRCFIMGTRKGETRLMMEFIHSKDPKKWLLSHEWENFGNDKTRYNKNPGPASSSRKL